MAIAVYECPLSQRCVLTGAVFSHFMFDTFVKNELYVVVWASLQIFYSVGLYLLGVHRHTCFINVAL